MPLSAYSSSYEFQSLACSSSSWGLGRPAASFGSINLKQTTLTGSAVTRTGDAGHTCTPMMSGGSAAAVSIWEGIEPTLFFHVYFRIEGLIIVLSSVGASLPSGSDPQHLEAFPWQHYNPQRRPNHRYFSIPLKSRVQRPASRLTPAKLRESF